MGEKNFPAYIVLVNYNNALDTIECLESLIKVDDDNLKIIVVDNSTVDCINTFKLWCRSELDLNIKTLFPDIIYPLTNVELDAKFIDEEESYLINEISNKITFIKAKFNNGFAAANNIAIKSILKVDCSDAWIWLLNNDTVVSKDIIKNFRLYIQSSNPTKRLGIVGTKLYYYQSPHLLQGVAGRYNPYNGKTKHIGAFELDSGQYDNFSYQKFDYVIGASLFVSVQFVLEVGLMTEAYFLYYEEIDWITRGRKKDWMIGFLNDGMVYHKEGASIDSDNSKKSDLADYYICRNLLLFTIRELPKYLLPIKLSLLIRLLIRLLRLKFSRARLLCKILISKENLNKKFNE
jgi:GT2 family glycosyltransferase